MRDWSDPWGKSFMRATSAFDFPSLEAVNSGLRNILGYLAGSLMTLAILSTRQRMRLVEGSTLRVPLSAPPVGTSIAGIADSRAVMPDEAEKMPSSRTDKEEDESKDGEFD